MLWKPNHQRYTSLLRALMFVIWPANHNFSWDRNIKIRILDRFTCSTAGDKHTSLQMCKKRTEHHKKWRPVLLWPFDVDVPANVIGRFHRYSSSSRSTMTIVASLNRTLTNIARLPVRSLRHSAKWSKFRPGQDSVAGKSHWK